MNPNDEEIKFSDYSKNYCICIIDIVNSTLVTATMTDSDDIRKYYSIFINTMSTIARNFDAKMIKNLGDSVICYFPYTADLSDEGSFKNVLECCITMTAANSVINDKLHEERLPPMQYRTSADYGKVEVARTKTSQDDDLFGSTINMCAKINKLVAPNRILIGGDLFRILKSMPSLTADYELRPAGEYSIGIKYSYPLYSVRSRYDKPVIRSFKQIPELKPIEKYSPYRNRKNSQQTQNPTSRSARVMLVDDDKDILFTFQAFLSSQGIAFDSFHDSREALKHFVEAAPNHYDLIILDIRMPNLNGLELYFRMKDIDNDIKILFVSALEASNELISVLPGVQLDNILKKPVEGEYFISTVKKILSDTTQTNTVTRRINDSGK